MLSNIGIIGLVPILILLVVIGAAITAFTRARKKWKAQFEKLDQISEAISDLNKKKS